MANGIYKVTEDFEKALSEYTGAPYVVTLDNQSNGLFLALYYENYIKKSIKTDTVTIPNRTYPSVPCEIIHAGLKVEFSKNYDNINEERDLIIYTRLMYGILLFHLHQECIKMELICVFHLQVHISILN